MAAYAVMARIGRADPHLTVYDVDRDVDRDIGEMTGLPADLVDDVAAVESDLASDPGPIAERLIRARELWRQTTFYLFDANSWRI
jgi:hypothetical protein